MSAEPSPDGSEGRSERAPRGRRLLRALGLAVVVVVAAALAGGLWLRRALTASLPQLDGERLVAGLSGPVRIDRDALGVPTIRGSTRLDLARATGFVHAQDRFFQMDLLRRDAAGELAELFGPAVLPRDRERRVHRFRAGARGGVEGKTVEERAVLEAYTAGVNAGLAALGGPPFEYLALRTEPLPWQAEDTVLVALAMFLQLHDEGAHESAVGLMHDRLPAPLFEFLAPRGTEWDAPLVGEPFPAPAVPGADVIDLRTTDARRTAAMPAREVLEARMAEDGESAPGSNNWAVAGTHTADGRALLADDMHLGISVPNTWYRASLVWPAEGGGENRVTGVTLPGTPGVIVGSNGHVAWGFTNSQGDWSDLVVLEVDPRDPDNYASPDGPRRFEHFQERLRVKGQADETLDVPWTIWGPKVDRDHLGRPRVLRWIAHDPRAVNIGLLRLESARDRDEALAIAQTSGTPPQNFVCADAKGRIGWTILGSIPRRVGFDGRLPGSWAQGTRRWDGWLEPHEYPRVVDPPAGRIWTANARVVDGAFLGKIGEGHYALGSRARQIRDDLFAVERATERDMLKVQLDDRAQFLARWRDVLLAALSPEAVAGHPRRAELRRYVLDWGGRATVDSVGYRAVRAFRSSFAEIVFAPLTAPCVAAVPKFKYLTSVWQFEGPLWRLVSERPPHLCPPSDRRVHLLAPRFADWDAAMLAAVDAVLDDFLKDGANLAERTWGERNRSLFRHPLSRAVPRLAPWLDMPREPLPGDGNMPRVQGPDFGASERLVVSPGREAEGFFHMPGGQSGHPLSPHYQDGHGAWARGEPTPFLPGPTVHTLTLRAPTGSR